MIDFRRMLASKPRVDAHESVPLKTRWTDRVAAAYDAGDVDVGRSGAREPSGASPADASHGDAFPQLQPAIAQIIDAHPRPQFARESFTLLDGAWECAFVPFDYDSCQRRAYVNAFASYMERPTLTSAGRLKAMGWEVVASPHAPETVRETFARSDKSTVVDEPLDSFFWRALPRPASYSQTIRVPFSPEAPLSGVGRQLQPGELLWYRRTFAAPAVSHAERFVLHFDGVDFACGVFLNGTYVGGHLGAYVPFALNVGTWLRPGENVLEVVVWDQSEQGTQLRGKQQLERGGIWYTAQSGIWKSAWYEVVPEWCITSLELEPDVEAGCVHALVRTSAPGGSLSARVYDAEGVPAGSPVAADHADERGALRLDIPVRSPHLWAPDDPYLYMLEFHYGDDVAFSYCGFRTVEVKPDAAGVPRFFLNGDAFFVRGVLDQGMWPDGLLTPPCEDAMAFDIEQARKLGFNTLRKHEKVESDRWYYLCDKLGMLVWQDMPTGGGAWNERYVSTLPALSRKYWSHIDDAKPENWAKLSASDAVYRKGWRANCRITVHRLRSHPCIVAWTLFNEGWGQFDSAAMAEMVRELDPTRPVDAASGWFDQGAGNFHSVHNYFRKLRVYRDRCADRPRAFVLTEFGGISHAVKGRCAAVDAYGYQNVPDREQWRRRVRETLAEAEALEPKGLAGYVYTQLTDVEEEVNGLLTYDRALK